MHERPLQPILDDSGTRLCQWRRPGKTPRQGRRRRLSWTRMMESEKVSQLVSLANSPPCLKRGEAQLRGTPLRYINNHLTAPSLEHPTCCSAVINLQFGLFSQSGSRPHCRLFWALPQVREIRSSSECHKKRFFSKFQAWPCLPTAELEHKRHLIPLILDWNYAKGGCRWWITLESPSPVIFFISQSLWPALCNCLSDVLLQVSDGASAVLMMTRREALKRGLPVLGTFRFPPPSHSGAPLSLPFLDWLSDRKSRHVGSLFMRFAPQLHLQTRPGSALIYAYNADSACKLSDSYHPKSGSETPSLLQDVCSCGSRPSSDGHWAFSSHTRGPGHGWLDHRWHRPLRTQWSFRLTGAPFLLTAWYACIPLCLRRESGKELCTCKKDIFAEAQIAHSIPVLAQW